MSLMHDSRRGVLRRLLALALLPLSRPTLSDEALAEEAQVVEIAKFAFAPAEIAIKAGGKVTFTNRDVVPHTATAQDSSFDTGALKKGESREIAFPAAGDYPYFCRFHRHMTGIVRVT